MLQFWIRGKNRARAFSTCLTLGELAKAGYKVVTNYLMNGDCHYQIHTQSDKQSDEILGFRNAFLQGYDAAMAEISRESSYTGTQEMRIALDNQEGNGWDHIEA